MYVCIRVSTVRCSYVCVYVHCCVYMCYVYGFIGVCLYERGYMYPCITRSYIHKDICMGVSVYMCLCLYMFVYL